jgi:hypothetical protein
LFFVKENGAEYLEEEEIHKCFLWMAERREHVVNMNQNV